jgi:hypothetical protein
LLLALAISVLDKNPFFAKKEDKASFPVITKRVWRVWIALIIVMISLYIFFNGF